jgi:endoglucanase
MLLRSLLSLAALSLSLLPSSLSAQFAHTQQKEIIDRNGKPLLLRATNLGNWFVPEGYMWMFEGGPQSAREIEGLVTELLGPDKAAAFWHQYR